MYLPLAESIHHTLNVNDRELRGVRGVYKYAFYAEFRFMLESLNGFFCKNGGICKNV